MLVAITAGRECMRAWKWKSSTCEAWNTSAAAFSATSRVGSHLVRTDPVHRQRRRGTERRRRGQAHRRGGTEDRTGVGAVAHQLTHDHAIHAQRCHSAEQRDEGNRVVPHAERFGAEVACEPDGHHQPEAESQHLVADEPGRVVEHPTFQHGRHARRSAQAWREPRGRRRTSFMMIVGAEPGLSHEVVAACGLVVGLDHLAHQFRQSPSSASSRACVLALLGSPSSVSTSVGR